MICAEIHMIDAARSFVLQNIMFELLNPSGVTVGIVKANSNFGAPKIADREWFDEINKANNDINDFKEQYTLVEKLRPGKYTIREIEQPSFEILTEDLNAEDAGAAGENAKLCITYSPIEKDIIIRPTEYVQVFKVLHFDYTEYFIDANGTIIEDKEERLFTETIKDAFADLKQSISKKSLRTWIINALKGLPRTLIDALSAKSALIDSIKKPFDRSEYPGTSARKHLASAFMLLAFAIGVVYGVFIAPLVTVFAIGLKGLSYAGFGLSFLIDNLSAYFSAYFFSGWQAVSLLNTAYPALALDVLSLVCIWGILAIILGVVFWKYSIFFIPKNPILDNQPEAIVDGPNRGIKGTAEFIRDQKVIKENFMVVSYRDPKPLKDSGAYLGFLPPTPIQDLRDSIINEMIDVLEILCRNAIAFKDTDKAHSFAITVIRPKLKGFAVFIPGDYHSFILGDTRSGKSRRAVMTTVDNLSRCPNESLIIFDSKGEIEGLLGDVLRGLMPVYTIDMSDPSRSSRWNPLTHAINLWEQGDFSKANQAVAEVFAAIAPQQENEGPSRYFNDGARAIMRSVALKIIADKNCPDDQKTISTVARWIETYCMPTYLSPTSNKTFVPYEEMLEQLPDAYNHVAFEAYSAARGANAKESKSFCSTAATYLSLFRDPAIADMTSETDIPITRAADERCAIFVNIPVHKRAYRPFATLFLDQAYTALLEHANAGSGRCKQRVNIIWDEVCSIPRWENLFSAINIGAGHGLRFFLYVQNLSIFRQVYKEEADGIFGNCTNKIFLKTGDSRLTAPQMTDMLGSYTAKSQTISYSGTRFLPKFNQSITYSPTERHLLNKDEVMRWKADYGAIVMTGDQPYIVPCPDISKTPFQQIYGLGDMKHNLLKILKSKNERPERELSNDQKYFAELPKIKQGKKYRDDERRALRSAFIVQLAKAHAQRAKGITDSESPEKPTKGFAFAAAFNTATGESQIWEDGLNKNFEKVLNNPSIQLKLSNNKSKIRSWLEHKNKNFKEIQQAKQEIANPPNKKRSPQQSGKSVLGQMELFETH